MAMVPHERSLVERVKDKPFALLGVSLDDSRETCKKIEKERQMNWRNWFDGSGGPIAKQWNVRYLPTIYVLDHKGVIRYKGVRDKEMDDAVDALLKELEAEPKK